jgi:hypothetical protein
MPSRWYVAVLFACGVVLAASGVWVAGTGEGSYLLIFLAGSPFSILGIPIAIGASAIQWGLLALAQRMFNIKYQVVIGFLALHYVMAAYLLFGYSDFFDDWESLQKPSLNHIQLVFALGLICYLIIHFFVWRTSLPKKIRS